MVSMLKNKTIFCLCLITGYLQDFFVFLRMEVVSNSSTNNKLVKWKNGQLYNNSKQAEQYVSIQSKLREDKDIWIQHSQFLLIWNPLDCPMF